MKSSGENGTPCDVLADVAFEPDPQRSATGALRTFVASPSGVPPLRPEC